MCLNRCFLLGWVSVAFGAEGPMDVILKLLRSIGEILKIIRSL